MGTYDHFYDGFKLAFQWFGAWEHCSCALLNTEDFALYFVYTDTKAVFCHTAKLCKMPSQHEKQLEEPTVAVVDSVVLP